MSFQLRMSFQLLFTCAIADERLEVADERLEGCQHYAFKEYKNANGVRILGGHADGAIQWECELFVGRPKARCYPFDLPISVQCQSTDFEGEIPRYIYLKYVVFQR